MKEIISTLPVLGVNLLLALIAAAAIAAVVWLPILAVQKFRKKKVSEVRWYDKIWLATAGIAFMFFVLAFSNWYRVNKAEVFLYSMENATFSIDKTEKFGEAMSAILLKRNDGEEMELIYPNEAAIKISAVTNEISAHSLSNLVVSAMSPVAALQKN